MSSVSPTKARTGQRMSARVTSRSSITKPPGDHPVVDAELLDHLGQRRAGPGDPALGLEEAALALARQQRLAVVELAEELEPLAQRLARVHQPEAGAAQPRPAAPCGAKTLSARKRRAAGERAPRAGRRSACRACRPGCRRRSTLAIPSLRR